MHLRCFPSLPISLDIHCSRILALPSLRHLSSTTFSISILQKIIQRINFPAQYFRHILITKFSLILRKFEPSLRSLIRVCKKFFCLRLSFFRIVFMVECHQEARVNRFRFSYIIIGVNIRIFIFRNNKLTLLDSCNDFEAFQSWRVYFSDPSRFSEGLFSRSLNRGVYCHSKDNPLCRYCQVYSDEAIRISLDQCGEVVQIWMQQ